MTRPANTLFIISDEHRRDALGCYGHRLVQTPNIDRLAASGIRFTNAYTPSPVCVPTRASLHTGQWVHQLGTWSSAEPYEGQAEGWAHRLREEGHRVASIGKLHFRNSHPRNGFSEEILPLHILNERGWTVGLLRDPLPEDVFDGAAREFREQIGPGESSYTDYDQRITAATCDWIEERGNQPEDKPWVLFLSLVCPHYPLYAPEEFYNLYDPATVDPPIAYAESERPSHPVADALFDFYNYDDYFDEESARVARASYYGLCSFLDHNIGQVLNQLEVSGLTDNTRIIYTSDHGDSMGDRGQWTKMTMYEESAGVPFIMSGPDIPKGKVVETPINLVDCHQTILEGAGLPLKATDHDLPGQSLFNIIDGASASSASEMSVSERFTFSEFHDGGAIAGYFMIRWGDWKYIYYVGYEPQLFNLIDDPKELNDLGTDPVYAEIRQQCHKKLLSICDPDAINERAFAEQAQKVEKLGGRKAVLGIDGGDFGFTPVKV